MNSKGRDWLIVTTLFVVAFLLRLPFRSQFAYHWDSAQFALAIREYNVALSQPHAPGYFLYVMLGRLVNHFVGDPYASLVWLDVVLGSALPVVLCWLGKGMFDRRTGLAAGAMAASSPQLWFHSCVALTYVVDAFWICLTVWWCWRAMRRGGSWWDAVIIGGLVAVAGGIRQQTVPVLCPLLAYVFWNFSSRRFLKLASAALLALALGAAWFFPMLQLSGGWDVYLDIVHRYNRNNAWETVAGGGWPALVTNCYLMIVYCWNGLLLATGLLAGGLFYRVFKMPAERKRVWDAERRRAFWLLGLWIVPMVLFGTVVGFTSQPGHVLGYLPAWLLLAGLVAAQVRQRWSYWTLVTSVVVVNGLAFVALPVYSGGLWLGFGRTANEIQQHDRQLAQAIAAIRSHYDPSDAVVCHAHPAHYYFGFRHFQLHLPEFEQYQLAPDPTIPSPAGRPLWHARDGHLDFVSGLERSAGQRCLLVVPPGMAVQAYASYFSPLTTRPVEGSAGTVYELVR